jgi:hypothetical protein
MQDAYAELGRTQAPIATAAAQVALRPTPTPPLNRRRTRHDTTRHTRHRTRTHVPELMLHDRVGRGVGQERPEAGEDGESRGGTRQSPRGHESVGQRAERGRQAPHRVDPQPHLGQEHCDAVQHTTRPTTRHTTHDTHDTHDTHVHSECGVESCSGRAASRVFRADDAGRRAGRRRAPPAAAPTARPRAAPAPRRPPPVTAPHTHHDTRHTRHTTRHTTQGTRCWSHDGRL